jgi:hypothetical protein
MWIATSYIYVYLSINRIKILSEKQAVSAMPESLQSELSRKEMKNKVRKGWGEKRGSGTDSE